MKAEDIKKIDEQIKKLQEKKRAGVQALQQQESTDVCIALLGTDWREHWQTIKDKLVDVYVDNRLSFRNAKSQAEYEAKKPAQNNSTPTQNQNTAHSNPPQNQNTTTNP